MIIEELYDALIDAGASEEKARAASRTIADMQGHFTDIRRDSSEVRSEVEGRLRLHDWMLGTILAFLVTIFFKVFSR